MVARGPLGERPRGLAPLLIERLLGGPGGDQGVAARADQVVAAYDMAMATPGPFLIDFQVKEEVNVYPMVPPGAAVDQFIRRPKPSVVQGYSGVQPSW